MYNEYLQKAFSEKEEETFLNSNPWKKFKEVDYRGYMVKKYSWAIPNDEAVNLIASYSPIIELGAGAGYWASLIAAAGADIIAVDCTHISKNRCCKHAKEYYYPVIIDNESILDKYPNRTLFICWGYQDSANEMIHKFMDNGGKRVIMVVEECAADMSIYGNGFFDKVKTVKIPQWRGIHDYLVVYERNEKKLA